MADAQVSICGRMEAFAEVLRQMRAETTVCLIACLTNFITSSNESASSSPSLRVDPILREFREVLMDFCQEQPERLDQDLALGFVLVFNAVHD